MSRVPHTGAAAEERPPTAPRPVRNCHGRAPLRPTPVPTRSHGADSARLAAVGEGSQPTGRLPAGRRQCLYLFSHDRACGGSGVWLAGGCVLACHTERGEDRGAGGGGGHNPGGLAGVTWTTGPLVATVGAEGQTAESDRGESTAT